MRGWCDSQVKVCGRGLWDESSPVTWGECLCSRPWSCFTQTELLFLMETMKENQSDQHTHTLKYFSHEGIMLLYDLYIFIVFNVKVRLLFLWRWSHFCCSVLFQFVVFPSEWDLLLLHSALISGTTNQIAPVWKSVLDRQTSSLYDPVNHIKLSVFITVSAGWRSSCSEWN